MSIDRNELSRQVFSFLASEVEDVREMLLRYEDASSLIRGSENLSVEGMQAIDISLQTMSDLSRVSQKMMSILQKSDIQVSDIDFELLHLERTRNSLAGFLGNPDENFTIAARDRVEIF